MLDRLLGGALDAMRQGDLTVRVQPATQPILTDENDIPVIAGVVDQFNDMLTLAQGGLDAYNAVADQWSEMIGEINAVVAGIDSSSASLATSAGEVTQSTEDVASSMTELATGASAQSSTLDAASHTARQARKTSDETKARTEAGMQIMRESGEAMDRVRQS